MIRGVAITRAAAVVPGIARLTRSEAPQSVRSEEIPGADLDDRLLLFERERADGQGDGKNLVRPEGGVISDSRRIDHVVAAASRRVPEFLKAFPGLRRKGFVSIPALGEQLCKYGHRFKRVNPERVDLHGLPDARSDDPVADFCVHPGELDAGLSRIEKPICRVHVNVVARALHVRVDYCRENREEFLKSYVILRRREILTDGFEIPERRIPGVIFRLAAGVRELVGEPAPLDVTRQGQKNSPSTSPPPPPMPPS